MIYIHKSDPNNIWETASESLITSLDNQLKLKNKVLLLLSGGSVINLYKKIVEYIGSVNISIDNLSIGQVDERFQPVDKDDINVVVIGETGLWEACDKKNIPYCLISQEGSLEEAADGYNSQIEKLFELFTYKIGVLGIGEDAHTGGLLPGYLNEWNTDKLVVGFRNDGEFPMRISVTPKALAMLDQTLVVVSGAQKSEAIKNVLNPINIDNLDEYSATILQKIKKVDLFTDVGLDDIQKRDKIVKP